MAIKPAVDAKLLHVHMCVKDIYREFERISQECSKKEENFGGGHFPSASLPLTPTTREDFRLNDYLEYPMPQRHYTFTNIHIFSGIRTQSLRYGSQRRLPLYRLVLVRFLVPSRDLPTPAMWGLRRCVRRSTVCVCVEGLMHVKSVQVQSPQPPGIKEVNNLEDDRAIGLREGSSQGALTTGPLQRGESRIIDTAVATPLVMILITEGDEQGRANVQRTGNCPYLDKPVSTVLKVLWNYLNYYPYKITNFQEPVRHSFAQEFLGWTEVENEWP
ncbi:hypothetical protein TNCV_2160751 [Trichonephila clavipes]|nr:hypothetical protein TNCV_2160751 [Trichonephila clavipes]